MKNFIENLYLSMRKFTIVDYIFFKLSLICIGVLIGVYLVNTIEPLIMGVWFIGGISLVITLTKVVNYYTSKDNGAK